MVGAKRWTVTYTKHLTQKRKVYQDGVLEICNSNKKVFLYDDSGKLLDSRFLKKDEIGQSEGTLQFEAYLVDVGEIDCTERIDLEDQEEKTKFKKKATIKEWTGDRNTAMHKYDEPKNVRVETQNIVTEWYVLYTKQKVQKAKKFHDGFLRLTCGGHLSRQIALLSEDGTVLDSRHLRILGNLHTGGTYEFTNYLVEIGVLKSSHGFAAFVGDSCKASEKQADFSITSIPSSFGGMTRGKVADNAKATKTSKPIRTACQIIFDLKKPTASLPVDSVLSMEQVPHMEMSVLVQSDVTMHAKIEEVQNKMNSDDIEIQNYKCPRVNDDNQRLLAEDALSFSDLVECDVRIRGRMLSDIAAAGNNLWSREPSDTSSITVTSEGKALIKDKEGSSDGVHLCANAAEANFSKLSGVVSSVATPGDAGSGLSIVEIESPECNLNAENKQAIDCPSFDLGI